MHAYKYVFHYTCRNECEMRGRREQQKSSLGNKGRRRKQRHRDSSRENNKINKRKWIGSRQRSSGSSRQGNERLS